MRKSNWMLLGLVFVLATLAFATTDIVNYVVGGSSKFKVTTAGNATFAGSVTAGGGIISSAASTPFARTSAQITALTPTAANQTLVCSDCTRSKMCVSSGTTQGAWVVLIETGAMATPTHCL